MTNSEYKFLSSQMEKLLKILTERGQLSEKQHAELDDISEKIAEYEEEHFAFKPANLIEMIELRMFQRKLKQKDVAEILGTTPSRISEILNGKREPTFEQAKGLFTKLNIDPALILNG